MEYTKFYANNALLLHKLTVNFHIVQRSLTVHTNYEQRGRMNRMYLSKNNNFIIYENNLLM